MPLSRSIVFLVVLIALSSCASYVWVKPGATQAEFEQAKANCMIEGRNTAPPREHYELAFGGNTLLTQRCHHDHCYWEENWFPPYYRRVDENAELRDQVTRACLFRNGWTEQKVE